MYNYNLQDDFDDDCVTYFIQSGLGTPVIAIDMLSNLYSRLKPRTSTAPKDYVVYAMYENNTDLRKIGKACEANRKMRHRMSLYGNFHEWYIQASNFNDVQVKYVVVPNREHAWALEGYAQGLAYARGKQMPWEKK